MVLDIDEERRRISLGIKQCQSNPWDEFASSYDKGSKVSGQIKSITDFGIFIGLDGGIDGLVHLSDISWNDTGEESIRNFKKGEEIEAIVLAVDAERERISLGIKQLDKDPLSAYLAEHAKGSIVKGVVKEVDAKAATIELAEGIDGVLKATEFARDKIEDLRTALKEGDEVEAKFTGVDRKTRALTLSIKAKEEQEEADVLSDYSSSNTGGGSTSLGDILKEQMGD